MVETKVLDVKGLTCPMPVIKTKKAVSELKTGEVLNVLATDPASKNDIPALIGRLGGTVLSISEREGVISFQIQK
ncbi:MAG: sulfurtransferase TusA family protein [Nitrospiraceae bacterium]|nr:sulfurtransferase TusA family protein [Nitrospiraceae bacterium]